jgi:O-antigen/teichoic acid export membrane protein
MMIRGVLSLLTTLLVVVVTSDVLSASLALLATWTVVLLGYDIPNSRRLRGELDSREMRISLTPQFVPARIKGLVRTALPLGVVMMLASLATNIPRLVLAEYGGERELGLFSAMAYLIVVGTTLVSALGQSASPRLAKLYSQGDWRGFCKLRRRLALIGVGLGIVATGGAALFGPQILSIVYTPEYAARHDVFVVLMLAGGIGYVQSFSGYSATSARAFSQQVVPLVITTGLTSVLCYLLVVPLGALGAAWALVASNVVGLLLMERVVRRMAPGAESQRTVA